MYARAAQVNCGGERGRGTLWGLNRWEWLAASLWQSWQRGCWRDVHGGVHEAHRFEVAMVSHSSVSQLVSPSGPRQGSSAAVQQTRTHLAYFTRCLAWPGDALRVLCLVVVLVFTRGFRLDAVYIMYGVCGWTASYLCLLCRRPTRGWGRPRDAVVAWRTLEQSSYAYTYT